MTVVVGIHQPNFFPWLGFFDKLARCDVFVLLDNVQFVKTGGVWTNRVKILIQEEPRWLTAPIDRNYHGFREIREMRFHQDSRWRNKILKTLEASYRRAPYYDEAIAMVAPVISNPDDNIAQYNETAIRTISASIGIPQTKLLRASDLDSSGTSTELLISLTLGSGGQTYMCGGGADGYQDESAFDRAGISLLHQQFRHPLYLQHEQRKFAPGLSIIDALVNAGTTGVRELLGLS